LAGASAARTGAASAAMTNATSEIEKHLLFMLNLLFLVAVEMAAGVFWLAGVSSVSSLLPVTVPALR